MPTTTRDSIFQTFNQAKLKIRKKTISSVLLICVLINDNVNGLVCKEWIILSRTEVGKTSWLRTEVSKRRGRKNVEVHYNAIFRKLVKITNYLGYSCQYYDVYSMILIVTS